MPYYMLQCPVLYSALPCSGSHAISRSMAGDRALACRERGRMLSSSSTTRHLLGGPRVVGNSGVVARKSLATMVFAVRV